MPNENKDVSFDTPQEVISINIPDLQAMLSIVDAAAAQGAFKPNQMMAIGTVYNKFATFIQVALANQQLATQAPANPGQPPSIEDHNAAMAKEAEDYAEQDNKKNKKD